MTLLHMVSTSVWSGAPQTGGFEPPSLESEGFVHLSTPEQVHIPANALYSGREDLVLLCIDESRLTSPLKYEAGFPNDPDSMLFPHLYGPLDLAAVFDVLAYRPGADGAFAPPEHVPAP